MSTPSKKRLMRDFRRLQNDPPHGISAAPLQDDIMEWQAVTFGPDDSPWEGGTFKLTLSFTEDYPNKAPKVKFVTKMFHPNIYNDGAICLDILQHNWSPIYDIAAILTSIQSLLTDPNPNSPANVEAAKLYQENRREYERRVQQIVEESWEQDSDDDDENDSDENENDEDDDSDDLDLSDDSDDDNNNTSDKTEKDKDKTKTKEKTKNKSNKNKNKNKTKSNDNNNNINDEKEDIDLDMDDINGNKNNNSNNNNNSVSSNKVDTTDEMNQNDGTMTSAAK